MKIHHIGYLTENIGPAIKQFEEMGYIPQEEGAILDENRGVFICFMENNGILVELISPANEKSMVSGILQKKGPGPYHICYLSEDLDIDMKSLSQKGFMPITAADPAIALQNKRVAFLFSKNTGMIELLEK